MCKNSNNHIKIEEDNLSNNGNSECYEFVDFTYSRGSDSRLVSNSKDRESFKFSLDSGVSGNKSSNQN